jgi:hypothetical protein
MVSVFAKKVTKKISFACVPLNILCIQMDLDESGTVVEIHSPYQRVRREDFLIFPAIFHVVSPLYI